MIQLKLTLTTTSDIMLRIIFSISVILAVISQVAIVNGCTIQVKLPLVILGYSQKDHNRLQFRIGDTLKFGCPKQHQITYNLTGPPKIQCEGNNLWSSKPPRCKATLCSPSPPTDVPNAVLLSKIQKDSNKIGKIAHYNCTVGYSSPSLIKVCQKNGYWQGNVNCTRTVCSRPVLSNGQVYYNKSLLYGSIAKYTCYNGYMLSGSSTRTCNGLGQWTGTQPQCSKLCPKLENLLNGHFEPDRQSYKPGQTITFKCISDMYAVKGEATKKCQKDGTWYPRSLTKCVINRCLAVGSIKNGKIVYSRKPYIIGTEVWFTCFIGFKLVGTNKRVCQRNGLWSDAPNPTCKAEVSCGEPGNIRNGKHFPGSPQGIYVYGTTVKYSCSAHYYLWGNSTMKCKSSEADGLPFWTNPPPDCLTLTDFSSRCRKSGRHLKNVASGYPVCVSNVLPHVNDGSQTHRQLDTLTIVTASAGSTLGALVILLSIMVFVRRFHRNRRFRHQNIRSRFYSDDDHVTLITCPRGYHFSLPSYDEAMSQVQRDPPPFDTIVQDNTTTVINNNINITMPADETSRNRESGGSRTHERTILQVSADQQVNIVNNPMPNNSQGELNTNSTTNQIGNSTRNSISSQESLTISEPPSLSISEDEQSINESQPLIGSN